MSPTPPFCCSAAHFPAPGKPENPSNSQCLWYTKNLINACSTIAHAHLLVGVIRSNSKSVQMSAHVHAKHQYLHTIPAFSRKALNSMSSRSSWTDGMQHAGCLLGDLLFLWSHAMLLIFKDSMVSTLNQLASTPPCFAHSCDFNFRA